MSFKDFQSNFLVVANFERLHLEEGMLQLRLKFNRIQDSKQVLLWCPMYEKTLIIDRNSEVTVN